MKIERKLLAHFIDANPGTSSPKFCRLGKDLEELNVELSAEVTTRKNILGEVSTDISAYEVSSAVEPYYADKGDDLFDFMQDIVDNRKTLDDVKTSAVEVHLWDEVPESSGTFVAYKETVAVEVTSYGGDTTGYQIPFTLHYQGDRVKGKWNASTKTFTADGD